MLRAGMAAAGGGVGFRNGANAAAAADSPGGSGGRLKGQLSFSSRQGSLMSQISEMDSEELGGSSPEGAGGGGGGGGRGYLSGYPMSSGWEESSLMSDTNISGVKRQRDSSEPSQVRFTKFPSIPLIDDLYKKLTTTICGGGAERRRRRRPGAPVQPAEDLVGDGGHREVPPVPGRGALQDPRQARLRHAPAQHRRAGKKQQQNSSSPSSPHRTAQIR